MNKRRVGINMISGGAGYLVPIAVNVFSMPYILHELGKEAYGLQALANVIIGYLVVADMAMDIPITQKVSGLHAANDNKGLSEFLGATMKIYLLIGAFGMSLVMIFSSQLMNLFTIPPDLEGDARIVFFLTSIGFLGSILITWGRAVFNGLHRYDISNGVGILNNLLGVITGIVLVVMGYGVVGFIFARVASMILGSTAFLVLTGRLMSGFRFFPLVDRGVWSYLKKQIGYGFALRMAGMILAKMDQTLISSWLGIAMVAVYSVPIMIVTSINGLIVSVTHFAFPMASALNVAGSTEQLESFFIKISRFIVVISTLAFVPMIALAGKLLALWISEDMATEGQTVLQILLIAFYLNTCISTAVVAFMVGVGKMQTFAIYGVGRGIMLFVGFMILIKVFGLNGAGLSYVVSLFLDAAFFVYALRKNLKFDTWKVVVESFLKPMLPAVILGAGLFYVVPFVDSWVTFISAAATFAVAYVLLGFALNMFGRTELAMLQSMMKKGKKD